MGKIEYRSHQYKDKLEDRLFQIQEDDTLISDLRMFLRLGLIGEQLCDA